MLIQVAKDDWILASGIKRVTYYKHRHTEHWTAFTETLDGTRYEKVFDSEEDAHEYCVNMVAKINEKEN